MRKSIIYGVLTTGLAFTFSGVITNGEWLPGTLAQAATATVPWQEGLSYTKDQIVSYNGNLYSALVAHTAYAGSGWNPASTSSLWKLIGPVPTVVPTVVPTATPKPTVTPSAVPTPTATPKPTTAPTVVPTATPKPTATATAVPTATPKPTVVPTAVPTPTATPKPKPTTVPTSVPTATPTPTVAPTVAPTATPKPTVAPTVAPTATPKPTVAPTVAPTATPTPTVAPTVSPTTTPVPTISPTAAPLPVHSKVVSTYKSYDALGRLEKEWNNKSQTTSYTYDANGNRKSRTDPLGRITKYDYDALNRLIQITDPANKTTLMTYDARDNLVQVTDPEGFKTSYTYNGFNDLIQLVSPDTGTTIYTQTASGQLKTKTDARQKVATYNYDNLGRVLSIAYGDATHTFTYDTATNGVGKPATVTDPSGNTAYQYDAQGYLSQVRSQIGATARTVGITWTAAGQAASLTYPSGLAVSYTRDATGQLTGIQLNGQPLLDQLIWSGTVGAQSWRWSNGQNWARVADNVGQVAGQTQADGVRTYSYDQKGNIQQIADVNAPQRSQGFTYDKLDQLTIATVNNTSFNYFYDFNGNRTDQIVGSATTNYSHETTSNRLKSSAGANVATYTYDDAGNRKNDNGWTQTYNNAGRLIQSVKGSTTVTYSYNALGQRVKKTSPNGTSIFVYDTAGHLLGEYLADGTLVQETVWLGDTPVAVVKPTADPLKPSISYIWADHLGTPRQISEPASKQIVWRWDGEPFGADLANENPSGKGQYTYNLRFPGQYFDKETGKHYNYFRDYDPATGRYVQSDPIGLKGGINTYAYVEGNPISLIDPEGLSSNPLLQGGIKGGSTGRIAKMMDLVEARMAGKQVNICTFNREQLDKKFKHAGDFGLSTSKKNPETLGQYQKSIESHLSDPTTYQHGTYQYVPGSVVHFNPATNNVVVVNSQREFVTGWKLAPGTPQFEKYVNGGVLR